jgi:hypothetical protein
MIGITVDLGGKSWGVGDFKGTWATERDKYCKWTEEDRNKVLGETCMWVAQLLRESGKQSLDELVNIPVEVTFDGNKLESWRVLTEVI